MKPTIYKPTRYRHEHPRVCPFCLMNASIGFTNWGTLGCPFCQRAVDDYAASNFNVKEVQ